MNAAAWMNTVIADPQDMPARAGIAPADEVPASAPDLKPEWDRIEWLIHCLAEIRAGKAPAEADLERVRGLQAEVRALRAMPSPWDRLNASDLGELELDILSCVLGAEAQPRIAWMLETLRSGGGAGYPSPALLQGILALEGNEIGDLYRALSPGAPLIARHLVEWEGRGPLAALVPGRGVIGRLLGFDTELPAPPGSLPVRIQARWEDLVLPPDRLRLLEEYLMWIKHKRRVEEDWGGRAAGGPVLLLSGPSGTGKTFAAAAIAASLGWPLFRVDLGILVSKYIGETEKNLNRLFDAAHGRKLVLQFDEADSLMGKRGDVKEARDRYANMEVSHLLSRMESHDGPCILTTNLRDQVDNAFFRRFHVVVDFPRPDAEDRARLWRGLLPPRIPIGPDLDLDLAGRAVSLSGGHIRNAALYAAFLAADAGKPLGMEHLALAVWREINKDGRQHGTADLGELALFLPTLLPTSLSTSLPASAKGARHGG